MTDIYLIEATFEYAEQVWQFRQEVFDYDNNSESQFAGCLSLDEAAAKVTPFTSSINCT